MPIATDPIGAIRKELIGAARRRAAVRRRRRRRAAVLAAGASMLVIVAGVSAMANLGTGVPAIDALLGVERGAQGPAVGARNSSLAPSGTDIRAAAGSRSERIRLPSTNGRNGAVALAYMTVAGDVCLAEAELGGKGVDEPRGSVMGCWDPGVLSRRLADERAIVAGSEFGEMTIVSGFTGHDVKQLRATGPNGALDVELTDVWTPNAPGSDSLRVFIAVDRSVRGVDLRGDDLDRAMDLRSYELTAELEDGQTVRTGP